MALSKRSDALSDSNCSSSSSVAAAASLKAVSNCVSGVDAKA
jgi:hypothetical protein